MNNETLTRLAREQGAKTAIIMGGTGKGWTFADLDARSNQAAHLFRAHGLRSGDTVAYCLPNSAELFEVAFGALRSGLIVVPISATLTIGELAYIVENCGAKLVVVSAEIGDRLGIQDWIGAAGVLVTGAGASERDWDLERERHPVTPIGDPGQGAPILYSSGTTGRPKGICWHATGARAPSFSRFGIDGHSVYLSPAPLYHTAPFLWALGILSVGGTLVVMEKYDPEQALALIERHRVTASQWVPTHFVRLLKLPAQVRGRYDLSSLEQIVHAAAPCPVAVKRAMIDWLGPIVSEYFGSTEQTTLTAITAKEWLARPGSVGRAVLGKLHVCDDAGEPLPPGSIGTIYSEAGQGFSYLNDRAKTAEATHPRGWTSVGDIGYLDEDGYLFLTDRKGFMIISGGVNIYPREIEDLLVTHPQVADAAVIGTPHPDLGEQVTAIVQPLDMRDATPAFAAVLRGWMRQSLSGVKVPRRIEFEASLPRLPTGKMQKFVLRERYADPVEDEIR